MGIFSQLNEENVENQVTSVNKILSDPDTDFQDFNLSDAWGQAARDESLLRGERGR
jgi:hypothetical protein